MGFHKRYINFEIVKKRLETNSLKNLFTKCDCIIFDDKESSVVYELFCDGKSEQEILNYINQKNMEVKL
jgi:hypothetical protein